MFRRRDEDDMAYQIQPVNKSVAQNAANATSSSSQTREKEEVQTAPVPFIKASQMAAANAQPEAAKPQAVNTEPFHVVPVAHFQPHLETPVAQAPSPAPTPAQAAQVREINLSTVTPQPREREVSASTKPAKAQSMPNFVPSALRAPATQLNAVPSNPNSNGFNNTNIQPLNINHMTNTSKTPTSNTSSIKIDSLGVEAERRLTVGYGISLQGRVSNCDKLVIYGTVNAELDNVKALHISDSGKFIGGAEVDYADISGNFEGELKVRKTIIINSTGKVSGKITYGSIEIKPGGKFTGEIIEDKTLSENNAEATSADATGNKQEFDLSEITDQKAEKAA